MRGLSRFGSDSVVNSASKRYLFLPCGPGLQSEMERRTLAPLFQAHGAEVTFFNEPSLHRPYGPRFDPDHAWSGWIAAAESVLLRIESPVTIIGCSMGAVVAEHLYAAHPSHIDELILISPTPDFQSVFIQMMKIAEDDFRSTDPKKAEKLALLRARTQSLYDSDCQQALSLTFQDPLFFGHYWKNKEAMAEWASILSEPEFAFDPISQDAVYSQMAKSDPIQRVFQSDIPTQLCIGGYDPVVSYSSAVEYYGRKFSKLRSILFKESSHFLHLENSKDWIESIFNPWI